MEVDGAGVASGPESEDGMDDMFQAEVCLSTLPLLSLLLKILAPPLLFLPSRLRMRLQTQTPWNLPAQLPPISHVPPSTHLPTAFLKGSLPGWRGAVK